ncbi:serine/threonine-protein kinase, partial [Mycobacterium sp. MUNTM1]
MSDAAQTSREGSRFGPYLLRRLMDSSKTGAVYEAHDTVNDSVVALKLLSPTLSADPDFRERMQHDLRAAERLDEPHLLPINDHGEIDGELFVDMRLIEAVDLATLIRESRELAPPRAVTVIGQVAAALDSLHAAGIEHGEITPRNILITSDDFVYVGGLGVGEADTAGGDSRADDSAERWKYVAPERFADADLADADIDYRVDIYALACVLYECLTGLPPYRADDADKMIAAHLSNPIPRASQLRPDIPPSFDDVIAIGMAKAPRQRFVTAGQLALAAYQALGRPEQGLVRHFAPQSAALRSPPTAILPPPRDSGALPAAPLPVAH